MVLPGNVEGRVASLADGTVDITSGTITIDQITSNNRPLSTGSQTSVPQNTLTTVATIPANGIRYITKVICSGEENAKWEIYLNNVLKITKRTTDRQVDFDFNLPMKQFASEVLDVKCTHHGPDTVADFQCTVMGYEIAIDTTAPASVSDLGAS